MTRPDLGRLHRSGGNVTFSSLAVPSFASDPAMTNTVTLPFVTTAERHAAAEFVAQLAREAVGFVAATRDGTLVITFTGAA